MGGCVSLVEIWFGEGGPLRDLFGGKSTKNSLMGEGERLGKNKA